MVERLRVGCSSTELLQRLSQSNQRERERAHFCPFQVNSDSTIPVSSCTLSLSGSWSQVQNNSSAHWQRPSPSYTYTHSQPVLIIIHTFIDGHFSSCDPCWGHKPYPLVIVTHSLTHTHIHNEHIRRTDRPIKPMPSFHFNDSPCHSFAVLQGADVHWLRH